MWDWPDLGDGIQSVLAPAGPHAGWVAHLSWLIFIGGGLILLLVVIMTTLAIFAPDRWRKGIGQRRTVIIGGIAFPLVTLTAMLVYGLGGSAALVSSPAAALRIEVVGEQWWWRVHYLDETGAIRLVTANEIRIPAGLPIQFDLKSADVIHSFWVPSLAGKLDMIPGRVNSYRFAADEAGVYRGQCAEYCGAQHALMAFYVVAMEQDEFEQWYADQVQPAAEPDLPQFEAGRELFLTNGCGACHTVRGTPADGVIGPDLTHVGSRVSLAAGTLPNNVGTLAGWIASAQHLKPDNKMPSFDNLEGTELRAIAGYLENLK
ncbi:MAG TPA: cytochrome c oxidase subunit II [Devosia sp.]|jgi:cytochrome c oxidase subunit 2|nr:cytochrome c oxidase subunit II [Devosia sp.]